MNFHVTGLDSPGMYFDRVGGKPEATENMDSCRIGVDLDGFVDRCPY